ncbi:MAG: hypothetical protein AAF567_09740 [Actinomycetota bacterium]
MSARPASRGSAITEPTLADWQVQPPAEAARIHAGYVATLDDRIERFGRHMEHSGLPIESLDWTTLDAFDDMWYWAQDHLSMFDNRSARLAPEATPWHPYMPGVDVPPQWPSFNGRNDLGAEANEFASGLAALLTRHAIDQWNARWVIDGNLSMLEIPRPFEHPAAKFGGVRFFPEVEIASAVARFTRHPLWHAEAPWHSLRERAFGSSVDWGAVDEASARQFHEDYIGGHVRRLSAFREWLMARGLDTTEMGFDHVSELERIWLWARVNVTFAEQVTLPRREHRDWYPQLAMNADPTDDLPRWSPVNLSTETLEFASGLAACATEVALRSWGADWSLGGRHGDRTSANRTTLRIDGRTAVPAWINPELEIVTWLRRAVITSKRLRPRAAVWRAAVGSDLASPNARLGNLSSVLVAPQPPWVHWHVRFEDYLLPGTKTAYAMAAAESYRMVELDQERETARQRPAATPMTFNDPVALARERAAAQRSAPASDTPAAVPPRTSPVSTAPPAAVPTPTERGTAAACDGALHLEPDDEQGDCFWLIEVEPSVGHGDPRLIERFTSRLNRSRGVSTATLLSVTSVSLRMNRYGAADLEAVERLIQRVWSQTVATHRQPVAIP